MSIDSLRDALPDYAWDQRRNLDAVVAETLLNDQQKWGCLLACAYATTNSTLIRHMESATAQALSEKALQSGRDPGRVGRPGRGIPHEACRGRCRAR